MTSKITNANTRAGKSNTKSKPSAGDATSRARKATDGARSRTSAATKTGAKAGQRVTAKADVKGTAQRAGGATAKAVQQPVAKVAGLLPGNLGKLLMMVVTMLARWPAVIVGGVVAAVAVVLGFVLRRRR
jgi:hypothetical protein